MKTVAEEMRAAGITEQSDPRFHGLVWRAVRRFRGTRKPRGEITLCPECGSRTLFRRRNGARLLRRERQIPPAPLCSNCGYNGGLFKQRGLDPLDPNAPVVD